MINIAQAQVDAAERIAYRHSLNEEITRWDTLAAAVAKQLQVQYPEAIIEAYDESAIRVMQCDEHGTIMLVNDTSKQVFDSVVKEVQAAGLGFKVIFQARDNPHTNTVDWVQC